MKKLLHHFFKYLAILVKPVFGRNLYMNIFVLAFKKKGVKFIGTPRYIHPDVYLDSEGGLTIGENFVASAKVIILTHDYSFTTGLDSIGERPNKDIGVRLPVIIGKNCFVGAGVIILPGSIIGDNVIVGAGSVVKGKIKSNNVITGNPAKSISDIEIWIERKKKINSKFLFQDKK